MKLSTAIRKGKVGVEQCFMSLMDGDERACALGMAGRGGGLWNGAQ